MEFSVPSNTMLDGKLFPLFITLSKKKKKVHTLILRSKEDLHVLLPAMHALSFLGPN